MKKACLFIGRWQPFHDGHKYLVDQALKNDKRVVVACRDTPISKSDPYTFEQRKEMIRRVYGDKVEVILIPDIESVNVGRGVGYDVNFVEVPKEIQEISATKVRNGQGDGDLPSGVAEYLKLMSSTIWFTGLPCSGKTTIAEAFKTRLQAKGYRAVVIDGDEVRKGLCEGLGFANGGREENLRRVGHVCQLFNDEKTIVLASFVSPTKELRNIPRSLIKNFRMVFVDCPLDVCEKRDTKGMYAKARAGEIKNFTGVDAPYEKPDLVERDMILRTGDNPLAVSLDDLCEHFKV